MPVAAEIVIVECGTTIKRAKYAVNTVLTLLRLKLLEFQGRSNAFMLIKSLSAELHELK